MSAMKRIEWLLLRAFDLFSTFRRVIVPVRKRVLLAKINGSFHVPVGMHPLVDTLQGRLSKPRFIPDEHDIMTPEKLGKLSNIKTIEFDEAAFHRYCPYINK